MGTPATHGASEPSLYLHIFRVEEGLGNACVLEFPDQTCGILDWGTQHDQPLEKALEIAGRSRRLRFVAVSHAHADHLLGVERLLTECSWRGIEVEKFVYPASTLHKKNSHLTRARIAAERFEIEAYPIGEDSFLGPPGERQPPCLAWADDGSWDLRVLSPALSAISRSEIRSLRLGIVPGNETSLVVLFRFQNAPVTGGFGRALLTGDATPATLSFARHTANQYAGLNLENQAFLVPHHGSEHNLPSWLGSYIQGIAIISGSAASPHHPSPKVLEQLSKWTCRSIPKLFCTGYARCCAQAFAARAAAHEKNLVRPGSCFGDLVIRVPRSAPATIEQTSADGNFRRPFGYCGNP